jgi:phytoene dehydrogenase-like protein
VTDAVVIGSGPNGLVAANILADHGWSVRVLEAEPDPGGAVRSGELTLPGFVHDRFSSFYPLAAASPAIRALGLEEHGLRWRRSELAVAHPHPDGSVSYVGPDVDATAANLDTFAAGDGDAWRGLMDLWDRVGDHLLDALFTPFPPLKAGAKLAGTLRYRGLTNFARFGLLPVRRLGEERFSGDGGPRLIAGNALHADFSPEQPGSAMFGWVLCSLAQTVGYPIPEGGSGKLSEAMVRRLGKENVTCGTRVTGIEVRGGRAVGVRTEHGEVVEARRAVLADVGAPQLYTQLLSDEHVPQRIRDALTRFQYDFSTFKVDYALDGPVPWTNPDAGRAGTIHVTEGIDDLTQAMTDIVLRRVPGRPFLVSGQYAAADPTRMPAGKEVYWAYTHVPRRIEGDAGPDGITGAWDERERNALADRMTARIETLAPGFTGKVLARHITTPGDFERVNANLVGGALNGGTAQLHQELMFRPIPGLGRSETPVRGLYLASASAYPSGGVHGACGANAARSALRANRVIPALVARLSG